MLTGSDIVPVLMIPKARPLFLSKYRQTTVMMAVYSRPTPTPESTSQTTTNCDNVHTNKTIDLNNDQ